MSGQYQELSIETIAGGDALKQLDYQLGEAVKNCLDVNTVANANRAVTLKIVMKPDNSREQLGLVFEVATKFPCDAPGSDIVQVAPATKKGYVPAAQMSISEMLNNQRDEEIVNLKTGEVSGD
jgi:hypothetical protein